MGMYDSVYFVGDAAKLVKCAAGHPQGGELQTKDLDCSLSKYYVFQIGEGVSRIFYEASQATSEWARKDDNLIRTEVYVLPPAPKLPTDIEVYTYCTQCDPVFFETTSSWRGDIDHRSPSCHWIMCINDAGFVNSIAIIKEETREAIKEDLKKSGVSVLPDDDRVVKKSLAQFRSIDRS